MKRPSLRQAIDRMCRQCIYDVEGEGGVLQQVTSCTDTSCALFLVRPITEGHINDAKDLIKRQAKASEQGMV